MKPDASIMRIGVKCYAGYRGEETPRSISFRSRKVEVKEVLDRWLDPDHRYFKILADDQGIYIIRHNVSSAAWELIFYQESKQVGR
jgi:hypothetical protein